MKHDWPEPGTFRATVSGDVDFEMVGSAVFDRRPNEEDGRWVFLIALHHESREGDGSHQLTLSNVLVTALETGMYDLAEMGPRSFVATYATTTEGGASGTYVADRGELKVDSSTTHTVRGRFWFTGTGYSNFNLFAREDTVTIRGSFDATISPDAFDSTFNSSTQE